MSTLHFCQWDWCRASFPSRDLLRTHLVEEHVNKAVPVKQRDVKLIRQAEDGLSGSSEGLRTMLGISTTETDKSQEAQLLQTPKRTGFSALTASSSPASTPLLASQPASPALSELVKNPALLANSPFAGRTTSSSSSREVEAHLTQNASSSSASPAKTGSPLKHNAMDIDRPDTILPIFTSQLPRTGSQASASGFRTGKLSLGAPPSQRRTPQANRLYPNLESQTDGGSSQTQYQLQTQAPYFSQSLNSETST
ncbi:hypothetical protein FA95DRAFT_1555256 [Auriscalpium vulgare]|uniref:Uncharacterized protein n=1 Tax=Auriscalpium vulgare TaxID=40419 RepID=A0ACB8S3Q8_9AGAM|nr:hypothetical protein FA95DRAFT_1555256 [Auriscalpium vulgare]